MSSGYKSREDPLRAALRRCRRGLWLVLGFGLIINLLFLATPLYMIQVFDRALASQRIETLVMLTLITAFALLILGVLETVRGRLLVRIGNWLEGAVSEDMIRGSVHAALKETSVNAQALRDVNTIRSFIGGGLKAVCDLPWMPLFLFALWLLHPVLGWFAIGAAMALFLLSLLNQALTHRAVREANTARLANEAFVEQAVRNADVLEAMGMLPRFLEIWGKRQGSVLALNCRTGDGNALFLGATRFVRMAAQTGILGLGAYFVIRGDLTAGAIIAGSILMGRALAPLEQSVSAWSGITSVRNAWTRLTAVTGALPTRDEPMPLPPPIGRLTARDLWYQPEPGLEPTLKGISFEAAPGGAMAIVGPSASGKTTLCKLLVGAWAPTKGEVRLDAAAIHDEWSREQLGAHVGYVSQDVEFFAATVKENIARLARDPDPAAVAAAAEVAGVHETILALPQGYDTPIGPGGLFLSGGQRQRIALARSLYGEPRMIVLDEPDSNLDGAGEIALAEAIRSVIRWQGTIVLVTHNARLLRLCDKIMVLDQGRIRFYGDRDEVMRRILPGRAVGTAAGGSSSWVTGGVRPGIGSRSLGAGEADAGSR